MKEKFMNWWNRPWTNGSYVKFCGIAYAITILAYGIFIVYYYAEEIKKKFRSWFKKDNKENFYDYD